MTLSAELINSNGISTIALAFFTALFSMVGYLIKARIEEKKEIQDAKTAADKAAKSAQAIAANTKNVSNGFASTVLDRLERIDAKVDAIAEAQRDHLEWHLEREKK